MKITHLKTIQSDKDYQNYDYSKFAVYNNERFCGYIFEHAGEFITTRQNKFWPTKEAAANSILKNKT